MIMMILLIVVSGANFVKTSSYSGNDRLLVTVIVTMVINAVIAA